MELMKTILRAAFLSFILLAVTPAWAAPAKVESVYTDISGKDCVTVEIDEEIGSSHLRCPGVAGFQLDLQDSDNRMSLDVVTPDGKSHPLDFWQVITWGFSSLGDKAEWRLEGGKPVALIVRVNASEDAEDSSRITSYLAVSKITQEKICVVAKIPPTAKANEAARKAADSASSKPCLTPPVE